MTRTLPNPHLLIRPFMSREAVLSSRIEGTQASLSDLFYFEASKAAQFSFCNFCGHQVVGVYEETMLR